MMGLCMTRMELAVITGIHATNAIPHPPLLGAPSSSSSSSACTADGSLTGGGPSSAVHHTLMEIGEPGLLLAETGRVPGIRGDGGGGAEEGPWVITQHYNSIQLPSTDTQGRHSVMEASRECRLSCRLERIIYRQCMLQERVNCLLLLGLHGVNTVF